MIRWQTTLKILCASGALMKVSIFSTLLPKNMESMKIFFCLVYYLQPQPKDFPARGILVFIKKKYL